MWHLLNIEWMKIRKFRAFLWLLGFFAVSVFGLNYLCYGVVEMRNQAQAQVPDLSRILIGQPFAFPEVWKTVGYLSSFLLFLPGLMLILLVCNEFSFRTHRQNILDGQSRSQFLWAKTAVMVLLGLAVTLLVFLIGCFFGIRAGGTFSLINAQYVCFFSSSPSPI
ncbi:MAG: hypothetical protein LUD68_09385 [Rikenellaceae bacterium]|nr:hypothetical protein [Rikenellaceae bacterium]